jgi:hypothetical protein
MPRTIDLIRANKLPSNMMQFAAKGALSVPPQENIEILVYLARHNKVFGDLARMTLAGWDENASLAAASNPGTSQEVLEYMVSPDNLRPKLLPALIENPSVEDSELQALAISASPELITTLLKSTRVKTSSGILEVLRSNPYLKQEGASEVARLLNALGTQSDSEPISEEIAAVDPTSAANVASGENPAAVSSFDESQEPPDEEVSAYLAEHASEIAAEQDKAFQPVGGIVDLLGADYFPISEVKDIPAEPQPSVTQPPATGAAAATATAAAPAKAHVANKPHAHGEQQRENTLQKINRLDVKGRIQLALKGNKEERSILIRDGTKVVALAVLDAPKITDGEVEKFALQKNVLEAVLRQIPLKRRFMKNYVVVRNLVSNPRAPLDLGLSLMKHLLIQDLKNLSSNKEVADTVRKLALKMYKQKMEAANKK